MSVVDDYTIPFGKIDADQQAIDVGFHTQEMYKELVQERLEKYVQFAAAVRRWAYSTSEGRAAAEILDLVATVDNQPPVPRSVRQLDVSEFTQPAQLTKIPGWKGNQ